MDEKFLKRYNNAQRRELQRVYDEIKWYVGEKLGKDPDKDVEGKKIVSLKMADVILNGFGAYLSTFSRIEAESQESQSNNPSSSFQ